MKILIVGAGGQGGSCASILARQDNVEEIRIADLKEETANAVADNIGSDKIKTDTVNATDPDDVARAAEGVDVVVDMVMPWMVPYVMEGALKAKANYINTAFDAPFWDKFIEGVSIENMPMYREFKEAGLTALFGCGFAPGWSPKQALIDCASPTYALEEGKYVKYPPFGGLEMWDFPEPVGRLPVTHHSHEEIYSMPATFKDVKYVDFKYYMMYQPAIFYAMGLCSQEKVKVKDTEVAPIDVVTAMVPPPQNNIFGATDKQLEYADKTAFIELVVEVSGEKDGKPFTWTANCPKMNAPGPELKKIYGTALVYVSLPLATGTMLIDEMDMPKGIIFADQLDPEAFISKMMGTGYPYKWKEIVREGSAVE